MWLQKAGPPLAAVRAGRFNLAASMQDQGWAPQILPQLPWVGGARLPEGLAGREGGFGPAEEPLVPQGDQAQII